ncbi:hypothetical protein ABY45_06500 [Microbacterium maritypicum]|uniref:hypothetical protein n=1 Tax=Microbacterium maritypicum TaxID=33918 RepID=UPI003D6DEE4F
MTDNQISATGLNARAVAEITATFNSLTSSYATVPEYIAYRFPGSGAWNGDECGCTDDRCMGHHHEGSECRCLEVQLDEFHDDLATAYWIREWLRQYPDRDAAVGAIETVHDHARDLARTRDLVSRLDNTPRVALDHFFSTAPAALDEYAVVRAVGMLGVDALKKSATTDDEAWE